MTPWLRGLGVRVAMLCAFVPAVLATHAAVGKPELPFALLESFDRAFALVYDAAERRVVELETAKPGVQLRRDLATILGEFEGLVTAACDAATARLDVELAVAGSLSTERRGAQGARSGDRSVRARRVRHDLRAAARRAPAGVTHGAGRLCADPALGRGSGGRLKNCPRRWLGRQRSRTPRCVIPRSCSSR
jgi:hypothetical protein